ncbi:MAG TPA: hypothetical protein VGE45_13800 [Chloroflexia bacterium]|jgi:hypothetical protein
MPDMPTVTTEDDINDNAGQNVRVVGRYTQIDVRKRSTPQPVYNGHASLVLEDGTTVLLEPIWSKASKRPRKEIKRYDGQIVGAVGIILPEAPDSPDEAANLMMPCLTNIQSISEVQTASGEEG